MLLTIDTEKPLSEIDIAALRLIYKDQLDRGLIEPDKPEPRKRAAAKKAEPEKVDGGPSPDTQQRAIDAATKLAANGQRDVVRETLVQIGVPGGRVRELDAEQAAAFLEAIGQ